jgi:hypothetical protein
MDQTNSVRSENGHAPLKHNRLLDKIAEARVRDMFEKQYFNHISPTGEGPSDVAQRIGYSYRRLAENIAGGSFASSRKIVDSWMQSQGHRDNILSGETDEIGVAFDKGVLNGSEVIIAVQIFGKQSSSLAGTPAMKSCTEPGSDYLMQIAKERAEVGDLNNRVAGMRKELSTDRQELEILQQYTGRRAEASVAVADYNAKVQRFNELLGQSLAKQEMLQKTIDLYNAKVSEYRACLDKR